MKTRLDQLMMSEFIELMCGDLSVLIPPHHVGNKEKAKEAAANIVYEYQMIVNKGQVSAEIVKTSEFHKAKAELIILSICQVMLKSHRANEAREILCKRGISHKDDKKLAMLVRSKIVRLNRVVDDYNKEHDKGDKEKGDIRSHFERQTAAMMAHFKFQIDTDKMRASTYAYLLARMDKEVKAMLKAYKKK